MQWWWNNHRSVVGGKNRRCWRAWSSTAMCNAVPRIAAEKRSGGLSPRERCFGTWSLVLSLVSPGSTFLLLTPSKVRWQQKGQSSHFQMTTLCEHVYTPMSSLLCTMSLPTGGNTHGPWTQSESLGAWSGEERPFLRQALPLAPILAAFFEVCWKFSFPDL